MDIGIEASFYDYLADDKVGLVDHVRCVVQDAITGDSPELGKY